MELKVVKEQIPLNIECGTIFNIITRNVNAHTHGFHKYPGKFIPHIPKWAIHKYLGTSKGKSILDPFCGSGTTLVEGILAGHNVIGIDIDPLSAMISKVKTSLIDIEEIRKIASWLVEAIKRTRKGVFIPNCETIDHWFTKDTIIKLSIIRTLIDRIPKVFGNDVKVIAIQDLLLVCFSSIIRRVSNADNQSQKTYVSHTKIKQPEEVNALFFRQLNYFVDRAIKYSRQINANAKSKIIISSSASSLTKELAKELIALAITSPPYIKAIDYIYNQMVELFWIGDLFEMETQSKQNLKKEYYIGNKQIRKIEYKDYSPYETITDIVILDQKLREIFNKDNKNGHKHAYITFKYFVEMENHFCNMAKYLKKDTPYVMVVGNSSVSDVFIDTAEILMKIAERNGFKATNKWGYKIKNRFMRFDRKGRGGIIKIDWVLELKRI